MKKNTVCAVLVLAAFSLHADTAHTMAGRALPEWDIEISYSEKYFEYAAEYSDFLFPVSAEWQEKPEMARGIIYNAGVRAGLPEGFGAALLMTYIAQKKGTDDSNSLHCIYLAGEKDFPEMFFLRAGLKIPALWAEHADGLLYRGGYYGVFASLYAAGQDASDFIWELKLTGEAGFTQGAPASLEASAAAGYRVFKDDNQKVDFVLKSEYTADSSEGKRAYLLPEARISFSGGFKFNIGAELLFHADDAILNRYDKILYRVGASYTVFSLSRAAVEKKDEVKEGATWREQGVDPEMVPESWLKEEQIKK